MGVIMGATWCSFNKESICDDMFELSCSASEYCRGVFEGSSCFTNTDTGSCTDQMMALHEYTASSSTARYNPANCNEDFRARMECSDNMEWIVWISTCTMIAAALAAAFFCLLCLMGHHDKYKSRVIGSIVLVVMTVPAVAGCWSFVTRKSTYDIGPGDQAGFYILYFMFVGPALLSWAVLMCKHHGHGGHGDCNDENASLHTNAPESSYVTVPANNYAAVSPQPAQAQAYGNVDQA